MMVLIAKETIIKPFAGREFGKYSSQIHAYVLTKDQPLLNEIIYYENISFLGGWFILPP